MGAGKTVFWIVLFACLALAGAGVYLLHGGGTRAAIYVDGELYDTVDLGAVAVAYERTVQTEYGRNTLRIGPGEIAVIEADCPGNDCVHQGAITDSAIPIVCLPHRLVIQIEEP